MARSVSVWYHAGGVFLYHGDVLLILRELPEASVHCCVTSPPYWGLRDYGTASWDGGSVDCDHVYNHGAQGANGQRSDRAFTAQAVYRDSCRKCGAQRVDKQIGLEATLAEYVAKMVEVFREVRRVLRDDGTVWLNLGDSYNSHPGQRKIEDKIGTKQATNAGSNDTGSRHCPDLKPKDLCGIPWRVAFALQADGWWLRSDIIWTKPAPMPESVTDRPTRSHEYIFLLAKSERYYYDAAAIREPAQYPNGPNGPDAIKSPYGQGFTRNADKRRFRNSEEFRGKPMRNSDLERNGTTRGKTNESCSHPLGRNKRDVWTVNTDPFPEAHFATFPPALIRPCVLAGCPAGGTVLDPFSGAATTALVAKENGRQCIGIELNEEYLRISRKRLAQSVLPLEASPERRDSLEAKPERVVDKAADLTG